MMTDPLTTREAVAWRKERDARQPLKRDLRAECLALCRDFIDEALEPVGNDWDSCRASLANDDDVGAAYHFRRIIVALKAAAHGFKELAT
jgi:hypothetical protein